MDQRELEELTRIVGGRFRLTVLLQKRMVSLMRLRTDGGRMPTGTQLLERAAEEVKAGKIRLVPPSDARLRELTSGESDSKKDQSNEGE